MSTREQALFLLAGSCLLLFAVWKTGFIGGSGAGSYREKNPINFWLGVGSTGFIAIAASALLISTFIS